MRNPTVQSRKFIYYDSKNVCLIEFSSDAGNRAPGCRADPFTGVMRGGNVSRYTISKHVEFVYLAPGRLHHLSYSLLLLLSQSNSPIHP